jgi:hypothetical protein
VAAAKSANSADLSARLRLFGSDMGTLYALLHQSVTLRL